MSGNEKRELKNLPINHSLHEIDRQQFLTRNYPEVEELGFCLIILSHNNVPNDRYKLVMDTILYQDYNNYHIIFIDDASTDATSELTRNYMK